MTLIALYVSMVINLILLGLLKTKADEAERLYQCNRYLRRLVR